MRHRLKLMITTLVIGMLIAACGGNGESADTTAESPDTTAEATDTTAGESTDTTAESTDTTQDEMRSGSVRLGRPSVSAQILPMIVAVDRLTEMGYEVEVTEFDGSAPLLQAAADGLIDIAAIGGGSIVGAIDAGLDHRMFFERTRNEFVFVGRAGVDTCEALDGAPIATHSRADSTFLLITTWFANNCPDAEVNIQVVPGSENRLAALLADQVDATALDFQDTTILLEEQGDDYVIIANFLEETPFVGNQMSASPQWLEDNEEMVHDIIGTFLDVHAEAQENPDLLISVGEAELPAVDPALLPAIVENYNELELYPLDGGLEPDRVQLTIDFYGETGEYTTVTEAEQVLDRSYLDAVLAER